MEHEEFNEHISELLTRYDPELAENVYPDELARILYAVDAYRAGYFLPIKQEKDCWGPGLRKYERVQACLRDAIHRTLGSEIEENGTGKGGSAAGPVEYHKEPRLLALAKEGNPQARMYCAAGYYFQAIHSLVNYPEIQREAVMGPLSEARNLLPCPELQRSVERVNELFGPEAKPSFARYFQRRFLLPLCMAAVIGSVFIPRHLSREHPPVVAAALQDRHSEQRSVEQAQPTPAGGKKGVDEIAPASLPSSLSVAAASNTIPDQSSDPSSTFGQPLQSAAPAPERRPQYSRKPHSNPMRSSFPPPSRDNL